MGEELIARKAIIGTYCIAIALACTIVPWKIRVGEVYRELGYAPIWSPPPPPFRHKDIDLDRVILEIVAITALGGLALVVVGGFKRPKKFFLEADESLGVRLKDETDGEQGSIRFCPECRTQTGLQANFCAACGKPLQAPLPKSPKTSTERLREENQARAERFAQSLADALRDPRNHEKLKEINEAYERLQSFQPHPRMQTSRPEGNPHQSQPHPESEKNRSAESQTPPK